MYHIGDRLKSNSTGIEYFVETATSIQVCLRQVRSDVLRIFDLADVRANFINQSLIKATPPWSGPLPLVANPWTQNIPTGWQAAGNAHVDHSADTEASSALKCTCGVDSVGEGKHSTWCDLYTKETL